MTIEMTRMETIKANEVSRTNTSWAIFWWKTGISYKQLYHRVPYAWQKDEEMYNSKEVIRILNAISLLYSLRAAQGHNYNDPVCAHAIWFLFLLPALSNQFQLLQCRQNRRQLQHCLSSNCRKQSLWRCAWGEQDRGPSLWLCWGNETQPPQRRQDAVVSLSGHLSGSQSI